MRFQLSLGFLAIVLLLCVICVYTILSSIGVQSIFSDLKSEIIPAQLQRAI